MSDTVERLRIRRLARLSLVRPSKTGHEDARLDAEAADEIERLRTRLAEAEKVIEPFAKALTEDEDEIFQDGEWVDATSAGMEIEFGHLRAARAWKEAK